MSIDGADRWPGSAVGFHRLVTPPGERRCGGVLQAILAFCLLAVPVGVSAQPGGISTIRYLDGMHISVKPAGFVEPSGLALSSDGEYFWSVSDNVAQLFLLGLDGSLISSRSLPATDSGLEGIVEDAPRDRLLVVKESTAEILSIPLKDGAAQRIPLSAMAGYDAIAKAFSASDPNDGLEGIAVDSESGHVYVLKERDPRMLIEISSDLDRILDTTILVAELGFVSRRAKDARLDVSGLVFDPGRNAFWILSDTGEAVFLFDPVKGQASAWPLAHDGQRVRNPEGIALIAGGTKLAIVTDDHENSLLLTYAIE